MALELIVRDALRETLRNFVTLKRNTGLDAVQFEEDPKKDTFTFYHQEFTLRVSYRHPNVFITLRTPYDSDEMRRKLLSFLFKGVTPRQKNVFDDPQSPLHSFCDRLDIYHEMFQHIDAQDQHSHVEVMVTCTENTLHHAKLKREHLEEERSKTHVRETERLTDIEKKHTAYHIGNAVLTRVMRPLMLFFSPQHERQHYVDKFIGNSYKFIP